MATYNFERVSVLLVEDNSFVRNILEELLRGFGVGRIIRAANGQEAIEILKTAKAAGNAGTLGVDLVISDLVMSPINGLLLLRWARTSKDSPNRFMPFVMLSGAADDEYVHAARDLGVTEFLSKPFSAESVYKRLLEVVDYPRQFVVTQSFCGPDRRRKKAGAASDGSCKRVATDDDITIVYSADQIKKPQQDGGVWVFRLPNSLKERVAGMGAKGPGEIPDALLKEAEEKLHRAALDFADWAQNYLGELSKICAEALMEQNSRSRQFEKIHDLAHELRGQGGTFGYPMISQVGKMLQNCTTAGCSTDDVALEIVKAHIDTMRAVIREKISGDGGKLGVQLIAGLKQSVEALQVVR